MFSLGLHLVLLWFLTPVPVLVSQAMNFWFKPFFQKYFPCSHCPLRLNLEDYHEEAVQLASRRQVVTDNKCRDRTKTCEAAGSEKERDRTKSRSGIHEAHSAFNQCRRSLQTGSTYGGTRTVQLTYDDVRAQQTEEEAVDRMLDGLLGL